MKKVKKNHKINFMKMITMNKRYILIKKMVKQKINKIKEDTKSLFKIFSIK